MIYNLREQEIHITIFHPLFSNRNLKLGLPFRSNEGLLLFCCGTFSAPYVLQLLSVMHRTNEGEDTCPRIMHQILQ